MRHAINYRVTRVDASRPLNRANDAPARRFAYDLKIIYRFDKPRTSVFLDREMICQVGGSCRATETRQECKVTGESVRRRIRMCLRAKARGTSAASAFFPFPSLTLDTFPVGNLNSREKSRLVRPAIR